MRVRTVYPTSAGARQGWYIFANKKLKLLDSIFIEKEGRVYCMEYFSDRLRYSCYTPFLYK